MVRSGCAVCCFSRFYRKKVCVNVRVRSTCIFVEKKRSLGGGIFLFFREKESSRQQLEKSDRFSYFAT